MKIAFTGDTAFTGYFGSKCSECVIDDTISEFLHSSDYVVANVETPITNHATEGKKIINIVSSPKSADNLVFMHMNIWNLCNNHADDCGIDGIRNTVAIAKQSGCIPLGIGDVEGVQCPVPVIVGMDDCKVGLVSVSDYIDFPYILTWKDSDTLQQIIRQLRQNVNYIVAVFHGGREFSTMPTPKERVRYKKLLEMGVDIVVAHHPHVVQNYETVGDKIIFYSLGNFIFDIEYMRKFSYTDIGMLLRIDFSASGLTWEYLPVQLDRVQEKVYALDLDKTPAIFRDIQEHDYRLMFPLVAKYLRKNERRISAYIKEHEVIDPPKKFKDRIEGHYRKFRKLFNRYRIMLFLYSSVSGLYKLSGHRDLYYYIKNS